MSIFNLLSCLLFIVFLSACYQRCFILFLSYSVMSQDEPISSGVVLEVQEAIKEALFGLSANL